MVEIDTTEFKLLAEILISKEKGRESELREIISKVYKNNKEIENVLDFLISSQYIVLEPTISDNGSIESYWFITKKFMKDYELIYK